MKILLCIDDTDNLESKGTGYIAEELIKIIEKNKWGKCGCITRHQLLLHKDIPYTSHNSSMCFDAEINEENYNNIIQVSSEYLQKESAEGSDPGICIGIIDEIKEKKELIDFGLKAKRQIIYKDEAYKIANKTNVYLAEKGGDGQGIIGALAGVGLRLDGNDGELKGGIPQLIKDKCYKVSDILKYNNVEAVCQQNMDQIENDEIVKIEWKAKPILHKGKLILLVKKGNNNSKWISLNKKELRKFGDERIYKLACNYYFPDVEEERVNAEEKSCLNCRYRRWTEDSFICVRKDKVD